MNILTTKQASELLGVSQRRVLTMIEQGKLKAKKFASVYSISLKDLETVRTHNKTQTKEFTESDKNFAVLAAKYIGSIKEGLPTDLSYNKEYLKNLGKKSSK